MVLVRLGASNHTCPGPLTWLQEVVKTPGGLGCPSSETVPLSCTAMGALVAPSARSGPALRTGARFPVFSRPGDGPPGLARSEERRVGKEGRSRRSPDH